MATLTTVKDGLLAQILAITQGLQVNNTPIDITSGIDWPSEEDIRCVGTTANSAVIAVVDRKFTADGGGWMPTEVFEQETVAGISSVLSRLSLNPGTPQTLTLSLVSPATAPKVGDLVSLNGRIGTTYSSAVAKAGSSETLATLAQKLATAINATAPLNTWMQATALGAVVTLTSLGAGINLTTVTGNSWTITEHVASTIAPLQVVIFANSIAIRDTIGDALEKGFGGFKRDSGFQLANTEWIRLLSAESYCLDDASVKNISRRDFLVSLQYQVDNEVTAYPVVAPDANFSS